MCSGADPEHEHGGILIEFDWPPTNVFNVGVKQRFFSNKRGFAPPPPPSGALFLFVVIYEPHNSHIANHVHDVVRYNNM